MGLKIDDVPGMTVNRYCASGLDTIRIAAAKIQSGMADCIIAGGAESMSYIPMGGYRPVPNYKTAKAGNSNLTIKSSKLTGFIKTNDVSKSFISNIELTPFPSRSSLHILSPFVASNIASFDVP